MAKLISQVFEFSLSPVEPLTPFSYRQLPPLHSLPSLVLWDLVSILKLLLYYCALPLCSGCEKPAEADRKLKDMIKKLDIVCTGSQVYIDHLFT